MPEGIRHQSGMIWTIPNILTMLRVLAAPCVALVFVILERPLADWVALGLFVVAALTDFLDGWLARRWGQESEIGRMLDPIADKAMVIVGLLVILGHLSPQGIWMAVLFYAALIPAALIVAREVLVSGLREHLGDVKLAVTRLAKWKTTAQLFAVGAGLFWLPFQHAMERVVLTSRMMASENQLITSRIEDAFMLEMHTRVGLLTVALLWIAAILTVLSGWDYFRKGLVELRKREVKG